MKSNEFTVPRDNATVGLNCCATFFGYTINDISSRVSPPSPSFATIITRGQSYPRSPSATNSNCFDGRFSGFPSNATAIRFDSGYTRYRIVDSGEADKQNTAGVGNGSSCKRNGVSKLGK